jgi:hypothetical protein
VELLASSPVRWWVAGGRAARIGATPRPHEDTDIAVSRSDLDELRKALARADERKASLTFTRR